MKTILRLAQKSTTRLTPTCCLRQQGFRDALQRLTMTLMLVMLTATVSGTVAADASAGMYSIRATAIGPKNNDYAFANVYVVNTSGNCGTTGHEADVTWAVTDENNDGTYETLTIAGTGNMADYANASDVPWTYFGTNLTTVIIGTLTLSGGATTNTPADMTCNNTGYYSQDTQITPSHGEVPTSYVFTGYTVKDANNNDVTVTENGGVYTFTMPAGDVTVTANWKVPYIDADGNTATHQAIALDGYEEADEYGNIHLAAGWYFAGRDISYTKQIRLDGDATIILADGCTMTINTSNCSGIYSDNALTIYAQSLGSDAGTLTTTATNGIGIYTDGIVTINGGTVNATGTSDVGIRSVDGVTINGGTVTTTGIMADGDVTINGGKFTATDDPGICSNSGTVNLGWSKATDRITASSYSGTVTIANGQSFINNAATPEIVSGTDIDKALVEDKTLTPYGITLTANANGSDYWTSYYNGALNFSTTATIYKAALNGTSSVTLTEVDGGVIPADNAVLLKSDQTPIELTLTDATTGDYDGNELKAVDMETPQDGTTNYYVLSKVNDNFGFFKLSSTKKLGAHKAYLEVAPSNNAPEYLGFDENTTEVGLIDNSQLTIDNWAGAIYDLQGRKVANPSKGLYIVNGKKVVIK